MVLTNNEFAILNFFISIKNLILGESGSHDEGIYIPHLRQLEMATSLPVDVPKFIVDRSSDPCDLDEQIRVT